MTRCLAGVGGSEPAVAGQRTSSISPLEVVACMAAGTLESRAQAARVDSKHQTRRLERLLKAFSPGDKRTQRKSHGNRRFPPVGVTSNCLAGVSGSQER